MDVIFHNFLGLFYHISVMRWQIQIERTSNQGHDTGKHYFYAFINDLNSASKNFNTITKTIPTHCIQEIAIFRQQKRESKSDVLSELDFLYHLILSYS